MKNSIPKIAKVFLLLFVICFLQSANAQAPQKMSYQAVIRNASNALVSNTAVGIQISILQTTATGAAVFVESHTPTTNANGLATIEIGGGTVVSGDFTTIDWAAGPYFIKTETDPTGGTNYTIAGTSQLLSVPYALASADNKWTLTGNDISNNNIGKVGINTTNPASVLDIKGGNNWDLTNTQGDFRIGDDLNNFKIGIAISGGGKGMTTMTSTSLLSLGTGTTNPNIKTLNISGGNVDIIGKTKTTDLQVTNGALAGKVLTSDVNGNATWQSININSSFTNGNTFLGQNSLINNTVGTYNTANGFNSLYNNTSGFSIVAIGANSLYSNTTGNFNVAIGGSSLASNTSGNHNVAIGAYSLASNTSGNDNVAVGDSSLSANTIGNYNVATGYGSLLSNTTGDNNTANGHLSLSKNTIGTNNTANGYSSLYNNTTGSSNTAIGFFSLTRNTAGWDNTAVGYNSLAANTTGNYNTAVGKGALINVTTGLNNTGIGDTAQVPNAAGDNQVRIGNTFITYAGIQVPWTITSDKRWKSDIKPSNLGLDFISKLNPVSYYRNNDKNKKTEYGFIAQELEETLNNAGATNNGIITKDDAGMYSVRYNDLMAPMVKAIQEQQEIIKKLTKRIEELERK
jgi:hypothetical protein